MKELNWIDPVAKAQTETILKDADENPQKYHGQTLVMFGNMLVKMFPRDMRNIGYSFNTRTQKNTPLKDQPKSTSKFVLPLVLKKSGVSLDKDCVDCPPTNSATQGRNKSKFNGLKPLDYSNVPKDKAPYSGDDLSGDMNNLVDQFRLLKDAEPIIELTKSSCTANGEQIDSVAFIKIIYGYIVGQEAANKLHWKAGLEKIAEKLAEWNEQAAESGENTIILDDSEGNVPE